MDTLSRFEKKVLQLEKENITARRAAVIMFWWCLKSFFVNDGKKEISSDILVEKTLLDNNDTLRIAMVTSGGLGDHLLFANYVYHFSGIFSKEKIDVYFKDKFGLSSHIFHDGEMVNHCYELKDLKNDTYDLILNLAGFPSVEKINEERVRKCNSQLLEYVTLCNNYKSYCRSAFRGNAYGMMKLCILEGRTLLQRGDIYNYLNIEKYSYPLFIDIDEEQYLQEINLFNKRYITIQTGIDVIYDSHVKQWPIEYYRKLVKMITESFPELMVVQVGNSGELCLEESNNTLDLLNKTDLEEIKVLLKNSILHIDIEGGLVHMRNALRGGKSIVLFGPTDVDFFGYKENLNIRSDACKDGCYQLTSDWPYRCPKTGKTGCAMCMKELIPETVFSEVDKYLKKLDSI